MQKKMLVFILILYSVAMFLLSIIPQVGEMIPDPYDKIVHFAGSFFLALIIMQLFLSYGVRHRHLLLLFTVMVLAVISEVIQIPIPERTFSYFDMLADLSGTVVYIIISLVMGQRSAHRNITGSHKP